MPMRVGAIRKCKHGRNGYYDVGRSRGKTIHVKGKGRARLASELIRKNKAEKQRTAKLHRSWQYKFWSKVFHK